MSALLNYSEIVRFMLVQKITLRNQNSSEFFFHKFFHSEVLRLFVRLVLKLGNHT